MNLLLTLNKDMQLSILSFLDNPLIFILNNNSINIMDFLEYEYRYKILKNEMHETLNFWSTGAGGKYWLTHTKAKKIKYYWENIYNRNSSSNRIANIQIQFKSDILSVPVCNLLRGRHKKNKNYKTHYHKKCLC